MQESSWALPTNPIGSQHAHQNSVDKYVNDVYSSKLIFVETSIFTRQILSLLDDASYAELQAHIASNPEAGSLIPGSHGLRKLRWKRSGSGKRGGLRVIYYWPVQEEIIFMLIAYAKSDQDDLSTGQLKLLQKLVSQEFGDG